MKKIIVIILCIALLGTVVGGILLYNSSANTSNPPTNTLTTKGEKGDKGDKGDTGAQGIQGEKGDKGDTGAQGIQGEKGDKGDTGAQGIDGKDGKDGADGTNGIDGKDGKDGADGTNGIDGKDGKDGADGTNGIDGKDGKDGADGTNGIDGKDGKDGTNGAECVYTAQANHHDYSFAIFEHENFILFVNVTLTGYTLSAEDNRIPVSLMLSSYVLYNTPKNNGYFIRKAFLLDSIDGFYMYYDVHFDSATSLYHLIIYNDDGYTEASNVSIFRVGG